jgi:hypothetical protein
LILQISANIISGNSRTCTLLYRGEFQREVRAAVLNKLPGVLREKEFPCQKWKEFDKGFACVSDASTTRFCKPF